MAKPFFLKRAMATPRRGFNQSSRILGFTFIVVGASVVVSAAAIVFGGKNL